MPADHDMNSQRIVDVDELKSQLNLPPKDLRFVIYRFIGVCIPAVIGLFQGENFRRDCH